MSVQKHSLDKKQLLSKQLYDSGYLWSYGAAGDKAMLPDEELILNGLSHLEFEDMPKLFKAFPYRQIKQVWQQRMLPYPDYYGTLNMLLAALFFHIKSPKKYVGNHVKLSFFAPQNRVPALHTGFTYNNLKTVDAQDALGMKLFTITVRSLYRDYYDIYSLLKAGLSFEEGLDYALKFTRHQVHSKAVLSALITPTLYQKPQDFDLMQPKYNVSAEEMANYFMEVIASRQK